MDNKWRGAGPVTHDPPPAFVFDLGHLKHFLVVVETSLTTKQKALPIILCNFRYSILPPDDGVDNTEINLTIS